MSGPQKDAPDGGERTALANDRTMLASERTLAAWWRTAIAALAAAAALVKLYGDVRPIWPVQAAAGAAILLALLVLFTAARRYSTTARGVENESVERVPRAELWIGTFLLALISLAVAAAVWWMG